MKTITFDDACKIAAPRAFTSMVKPVGANCNLDCTYCYYLGKSALYPTANNKMSDKVLEEYIVQTIEGNDVPAITFCWHGGEPMLTGIDFYRRAFAIQKRRAGVKRIINTFQTNGTLIDREWCDLFREHDVLVGVSIDGPEDLHDYYRVNKAGDTVFARVMKGIEQMNRAGVEFNTLSTVHKMSEGRGVEVYRFLKSIGSRYMQFLPVAELIADDRITAPGRGNESALAPWSVDSLAYGRFMTDIFDEWINHDVGTYFVQLFDAALAQWHGVQPGLCVFAQHCGDAMAVEYNGDVYSCDHFVYPEYKLGNLMDKSIRSMYVSERQFAFGMAKKSRNKKCMTCDYLFACTGGCPKHRFGGPDSVNYLCEGYHHFFKHVEPYMIEMSNLLTNQQSPALYK